jgi:dolichyl-phosphate mannosyltransferase polypeptide 3
MVWYSMADTETTTQLPFWFLVSFGAWLLFRLGWGMLTFRDTPDAYAELMEEIKLAKADLRTKGVDVD